mmetsp:Transcript_68650/g.182890  ORF Transcript_68650/g.182890 Transcript_68650/m.182890 type:complete len:299 (-) Transcript_68650:123-1019(-)
MSPLRQVLVRRHQLPLLPRPRLHLLPIQQYRRRVPRRIHHQPVQAGRQLRVTLGAHRPRLGGRRDPGRRLCAPVQVQGPLPPGAEAGGVAEVVEFAGVSVVFDAELGGLTFGDPPEPHEGKRLGVMEVYTDLRGPAESQRLTLHRLAPDLPPVHHLLPPHEHVGPVVSQGPHVVRARGEVHGAEDLGGEPVFLPAELGDAGAAPVQEQGRGRGAAGRAGGPGVGFQGGVGEQVDRPLVGPALLLPLHGHHHGTVHSRLVDLQGDMRQTSGGKQIGCRRCPVGGGGDLGCAHSKLGRSR